METKQQELRDAIKPYINSVNSLAKKWGIDPIHFNRWYRGMPVGEKTENKIVNGIKKLK